MVTNNYTDGAFVDLFSSFAQDILSINNQLKNPMLFVGPTPKKTFKCKPIRVKDSFKRTSNKTISRVGTV